MPSRGASGYLGSSDNSFIVRTRPPGQWAKTSVKVPPRSIAKKNFSGSETGACELYSNLSA